MYIKKILFLFTISAGYVSSISFTHVRHKRVSGNDYLADLDETLEGGDDYYTAYDSYEYYNYETFSCEDNRGKIALLLLCDGFIDCFDGSDEKPTNCKDSDSSPPPSSPAMTTSPTELRITTTTQDIIKPALNMLDDDGDYPSCFKGEFQCSSDWSVCLPASQVCDGIDDCPEREDELSCFDKPPKETIDAESVESWVRFDNPVLKKVMDTYSEQSQKDDTASDDRFRSSTSDESYNSMVSFRTRPTTRERYPHFISIDKEDDNQALELLGDNRYIRIEGDCIECSYLRSIGKISTPPNSERVRMKPIGNYNENGDEVVEINHATGEVILIQNGHKRPLIPVIPSTYHTGIESELSGKLGELDGMPEDYSVQQKQLRGLVGKLLHHVGYMLEGHAPYGPGVESSPNSQNPGKSLYKRIANAENPVLILNLELRL